MLLFTILGTCRSPQLENLSSTLVHLRRLGLEAPLSPPYLGAGETAPSCPGTAPLGLTGCRSLVVISPRLHLAGAAVGQRECDHMDAAAAAAAAHQIMAIKQGATSHPPQACLMQQ